MGRQDRLREHLEDGGRLIAETQGGDLIVVSEMGSCSRTASRSRSNKRRMQ